VGGSFRLRYRQLCRHAQNPARSNRAAPPLLRTTVCAAPDSRGPRPSAASRKNRSSKQLSSFVDSFTRQPSLTRLALFCSVATRTFIWLNICLILPVSLVGQRRPEGATSKSCREFVASFYAWYAPIARADHKGPASDLAWEKRPTLFTKDLVGLLREESEAQNKAGADLVSLDADPFLGADGAGGRYVVKKTTTKGDTCWAEVHAVWDGGCWVGLTP
jgi:hypothetical protein